MSAEGSGGFEKEYGLSKEQSRPSDHWDGGSLRTVSLWGQQCTELQAGISMHENSDRTEDTACYGLSSLGLP